MEQNSGELMQHLDVALIVICVLMICLFFIVGGIVDSFTRGVNKNVLTSQAQRLRRDVMTIRLDCASRLEKVCEELAKVVDLSLKNPPPSESEKEELAKEYEEIRQLIERIKVTVTHLRAEEPFVDVL